QPDASLATTTCTRLIAWSNTWKSVVLLRPIVIAILPLARYSSPARGPSVTVRRTSTGRDPICSGGRARFRHGGRYVYHPTPYAQPHRHDPPRRRRARRGETLRRRQPDHPEAARDTHGPRLRTGHGRHGARRHGATPRAR